jgi:hypothetical protein
MRVIHHLEVAKVKIALAERLLREAQLHLRDGYKKGMLPKTAAHKYDQLIDQHSKVLEDLVEDI